MRVKRSYSGVLAAAAATAFSLQAGVSAAAGGSPAVTGAGQTSGAADAATMARVKAALAADNQLSARNIEVSVKEGVVRLGGQVESEQDLRLAELDAKSVAGVRKVDNQIELKASPGRKPH
jgi:hyperosmotically inducible protein